MLKKHLRVREENTWSSKNTFSDAAKTLFFGCWKNTAGADKTPWMLRKPQVLKKHLLDAEKVPDAGKTPFNAEKIHSPFGS